ncbi:MAG: cysteine desulfurase [Melioribacteraceae bacterium]|nr:cysteine desulfurase [Melioribacteraceae bacterium]
MKEKLPIYLDYNATTPIAPEVAEYMKPFLTDYFGNPSSSHYFGVRAKEEIVKARKSVADMLNCSAEEIIFTSGGTEANNLAIKGIAEANISKGNHIITSTVEHPAVLNVCKYLESKDFEITIIPVDQYGRVNPKDVEDAIKPETILITIMHSNNEVGTSQPIEEISEIAKRHKVIFHTDCAQSIGKVKIDVKELGVDLLSVAGHKFYAPKGVGVLYIKIGTKVSNLMQGAGHERGLRPGTENILEIAGLGKAAELVKNNLNEYSSHMLKMRNRFEKGVLESCKNVRVNGHPENRLPNTSNIGFKDISAYYMLSQIPQIAASPGSACNSKEVQISNVLKQMNVPIEFAEGTIRFSFGRTTKEEEIDRAVMLIGEFIKRK